VLAVQKPDKASGDMSSDLVLAPEHDPFYSKNMYLTFGDLGASIKGTRKGSRAIASR